jgi:Tol biopolymer transport system component
MSSIVRSLTIALLVALLIQLDYPASAQDDEPPSLVEQRLIEIPDTRIIALSPDGTAIAAASFDMNRLCIYERDSLAERVCADLAPLETGLRVEDVVWSPDSSKLVVAEQAFVRFVDGDLWLLDAFTGELTNLTDDGVNARLPFGDQDAEFDEVFVDVDPAWLPDGSGITFSRSTWRDGGWQGNTIVTVPVTGGEPELLTTVSTEAMGVAYFGMSWIADGSMLYYSVNYPDPEHPNNGIWRVNANGSGNEKLVGRSPELEAPALGGVSPDGRFVLAHYFIATAERKLTADHLYATYDVETGDLTPVVVSDPMLPKMTAAWPASLTPDGAFVVYTGSFTEPENQILIRPVAGGEETSLTPEGIENGAVVISLYTTPAWSDDGSVLFQSGNPSTAVLITVAGVAADAPPPNDPATPVAGVPEPGYIAGDVVTVNDNDVPLRSAPGVAGQTVAHLAFGTELTVVGPAVAADGRDWIPVVDPATGTIGYIRAEFIDPVD